MASPTLTGFIRAGTMAPEGEDLRNLPLQLRKNNLARLLARRPEGIMVSDFERGDGRTCYRVACNFGLEAFKAQRPAVSCGWIVSLDQGKNLSHPALERVKESFLKREKTPLTAPRQRLVAAPRAQ
jgi:bifunctional non-homologous end joining protein LigD